MKFSYIFLSFLFITISVNAQSNYKKGYILTNNNDTINGLIDFRTDKSNSSICRFKSSSHATEQIFHPGEIKGYRLINERKYYVSHPITVDSVSMNVFLEFLVKGIKNLYFYPGEIDYYFFENEDGRMIPLSKKTNQIVDYKFKIDLKYRGILGYVFRDCDPVLKKVENVGLGRSSMIELTKRYHDEMCTSGEECLVFENDYKKKFTKINFSLYGGLQYIDYSFGREELILFESAKSIMPVIGSQINISNPRFIKSLSLQGDLSLSSIKGNTDFSATNSVYSKYNFQALMASGKLGLKYTLNTPKVRPTIEAGGVYQNLFKSSSSLYSEMVFTNKTFRTNQKDDKALPQSSFWGLYCGIGLDYKLKNERFIFCRMTYETSTGYNDKMKIAQLKIGYTF